MPPVEGDVGPTVPGPDGFPEVLSKKQRRQQEEDRRKKEQGAPVSLGQGDRAAGQQGGRAAGGREMDASRNGGQGSSVFPESRPHTSPFVPPWPVHTRSY